MTEGMEAVLSCGDVVDEWGPVVPSEKRPEILMTRCSKCQGQWRRLVEIRPKTT